MMYCCNILKRLRKIQFAREDEAETNNLKKLTVSCNKFAKSQNSWKNSRRREHFENPEAYSPPKQVMKSESTYYAYRTSKVQLLLTKMIFPLNMTEPNKYEIFTSSASCVREITHPISITFLCICIFFKGISWNFLVRTVQDSWHTLVNIHPSL